MSIDNDHPVPSLSCQERRVLQHWFAFPSKEAVADHLYLSQSAVATYVQRARAKYAAVGRPAATQALLLVRLLDDGYVSTEDIVKIYEGRE